MINGKVFLGGWGSTNMTVTIPLFFSLKKTKGIKV
jgi:hypothetical protein